MKVAEAEMQAATPPAGLYATAAPAWWKAGWGGVLPFPPGCKSPPPKGRTGHDGEWPTELDYLGWVNGKPNHNVGIRVPRGVAGIDVDQYGEKQGGVTLAALEAKLGPLPPTWVSTAREHPSGIRLFKIPPDVKLSGGLTAQIDGARSGDIEIIQHHHRYMVVAPSVAEDKDGVRWTYRVISPDGEVINLADLPSPDDLPELPEAWLEYARADSRPATPADYPPVEPRTETAWSSEVQSTFNQTVGQLARGGGEARHDQARDASAKLARQERRRYPGATSALDALGRCFVTAVTPDRPGGQTEARAEWQRMLDGARNLTQTTQSELPDYQAPPTMASADDDDPSDWDEVDLTAALDGRIETAQPTVLLRTDGQGLFYPGRVNGIHGDSGLGKSWVFVAAAAQAIHAGHHAVLVDFEDPNETTVIERLRTIGATTDEIAGRFHYYNPKTPASDEAIDRLCERAAVYEPVLIGVDSLGEAFGLEGINEDRDNEVAPWLRRVPRRLADRDPTAAVVVVDHATKSQDNPLHPSGSKRKRAAVTGSSFVVTAPTPLNKMMGGVLELTTAKDRHGNYRRGKLAARLVFTRQLHGGMSCEVVPPPAEQPGGAPSAQPDLDLAIRKLAAGATEIARVYMEEHGVGPSKAHIESTLKTKAGNIKKRAGIDLAIDAGSLRLENKGAGQAHRLYYMKPFVADLDTATDLDDDGQLL